MTGVASLAVIAAIRFDAAAVGIDRIHFRTGVSSERGRGFEKNAAVAENIGGEKIFRTVSQGQRLSASQIRDFDYESTRDSARIDHSIFGQIKRANAIFTAGGDSPWRPASKGDFPDLPGILNF